MTRPRPVVPKSARDVNVGAAGPPGGRPPAQTALDWHQNRRPLTLKPGAFVDVAVLPRIGQTAALLFVTTVAAAMIIVAACSSSAE